MVRCQDITDRISRMCAFGYMSRQGPSMCAYGYILIRPRQMRAIGDIAFQAGCAGSALTRIASSIPKKVETQT